MASYSLVRTSDKAVCNIIELDVDSDWPVPDGYTLENPAQYPMPAEPAPMPELDPDTGTPASDVLNPDTGTPASDVLNPDNADQGTP